MKHPNHTQLLPNMRRIEGQVRGVAKMIEEEKYCVDVLNQLKAIRKALSTVEGKVLETHLNACVRGSLAATDDFDAKVEELLKVLKR
ncbi:MAG: metal-sensing transcriptional repressor [Proteobacteria bacterium]|nr:metal-sensing transcriptional repressor [Pseudomonadota bacterium]